MATGFTIGQLVGALARGPLTATGVLTGHSTVDIIGVGNGTSIPQICFLHISTNSGNNCQASINCDGDSRHYPVPCQMNGNNLFHDDRVGDIILSFTGGAEGVQSPLGFGGKPQVTIPRISDKPLAFADDCGGHDAEDCDGNNYTIISCIRTEEDANDGYTYHLALPFEGRDDGCPTAGHRRQSGETHASARARQRRDFPPFECFGDSPCTECAGPICVTIQPGEHYP